MASYTYDNERRGAKQDFARRPVTGRGFATPDHDHDSCIADALTAAAELCRTRGVRLTEQRRRVLELVWQSHEPVGAYGVLRALGAGGRPPAPPTVYRALDFLVDQGFVHRLESLNAYVGCIAPHRSHVGQFMICGGCGSVAELDDARITGAIGGSASDHGFAVARATVEIFGQCPNCAAQPDGGDG